MSAVAREMSDTMHYIWNLLPLTFFAIILTGCTRLPQDVVDIEVTQVNKISIERYDEKAELRMEDGEWRMVSPVDAPANPVPIENLLMTIDKLSVEKYITDDESEFMQYGVGTDAPTISLTSPEKSVRVRVGRGGKDVATQYIRVDDDPNVYLVRGRINTIIRADVWRERIITDIDLAIVEEVRFFTPNGEMTLLRTPEGWKLTDTDGVHPIDEAKIEEWAAYFSPLHTDRFSELTSDIVLENADRRIEFGFADGSWQEIHFLDVGGEYSIVSEGTETVFQIFGLRVVNMFPDRHPFY